MENPPENLISFEGNSENLPRNLELETRFRNLVCSKYRIVSDVSNSYNCMAWANQDMEKIWWPKDCPDVYWPDKSFDKTPNGFVNVFTQKGYEICDNPEHEIGCEKIALYLKYNDVKHVAYQRSDGVWTSKCGEDWHDIEHELFGLECELYGKAEIFLKRKCNI